MKWKGNYNFFEAQERFKLSRISVVKEEFIIIVNVQFTT